MNKPQDPEAAETVQTANVPAVDLPRLVRPYVDGEDLSGRLMCYHCRHSFPAPLKATHRYDEVQCLNCGEEEMREHYRCADNDPLRHPLGWPYDDPTFPYDC